MVHLPIEGVQKAGLQSCQLIKVFLCVFGQLCNGDERQQKVLSVVSFIPLFLNTNGANSNKHVITVQKTSLKPILLVIPPPKKSLNGLHYGS
jgi:hypothetical protein